MLARVAGLLESRSAMVDWTDDARTALALALADESMTLSESWKAVTLRRHLFGPLGDVPAHLVAAARPSDTDRRRAERLRSDLAACVRYRAGRYLLP